jgi:hypothetical protein
MVHFCVIVVVVGTEIEPDVAIIEITTIDLNWFNGSGVS